MKQILQNLKTGNTEVVEVPCPTIAQGQVLIRSTCTLISAGTERMLIDFSKASLLEKVRQQPDKAKQVLTKVRTDGLLSTLDAVKSKLDQPIPLGYCNAGVILESNVRGLVSGDRVVSNGPHAEIVRIPGNLCSKIPASVEMEQASFTVLAAVGLQGIRLLKPTLGECFVVVGLGLMGQICVQMLRANGCRVLGVDLNATRCKLAKRFGAEVVNPAIGEDVLSVAGSFSRGIGVDGVLITAATKSDELMHQAAEMCRQRGRIVLAGVVGLNLRRSDFFKKELTFQVSCSYGPGRYDHQYEDLGQDYPVGFVRWTERRNFEAVLDLLSTGGLNVTPLVSHHFAIDDAPSAYQYLDSPDALGIVLDYPKHLDESFRSNIVELKPSSNSPSDSAGNIAVVGAGNYASRILIPAFIKAGARMKTIVSSGGVTAVHHGKNMGFEKAATDYKEILKDSRIDTVVIVTRHDAHAKQTIDAIESGKHVFVEKPLALTFAELDHIEMVYKNSVTKQGFSPIVMVGFNRRFAPLISRMKKLIKNRREPMSIVMTINAGEISEKHWTQDIEVGGGRIIGEACHFVDLARFLADNPISDWKAMCIGEAPGMNVRDDKAIISLRFSGGSVASIQYLANGGKAFPKERIEVFCGDAVLQLNNFRELRGFSWPGFKVEKNSKQDKGQLDCVKAFINSIQGKSSDALIPFTEIMEVSRTTVAIAEFLRNT